MQYTRKVKILGEEPKEPNLVTIDLDKFKELMRCEIIKTEAVFDIIEQSTATPKQKLKPVVLKHVINGFGNNATPALTSKDWKNISLIRRNYCDGGYDLFICWELSIDKGILYLGHLNDGVY